MSSQKIELMTQAAPDHPGDVRESTLRKLLELVEEDVQNNDAEAKEQSENAVLQFAKDPLSGLDHSKKALHPIKSPEVDEDGFEVPTGKIPLDGHFSSKEVAELVNHAKDQGLLKDSVEVQVLESNDRVGDKVQVVEKD